MQCRLHSRSNTVCFKNLNILNKFKEFPPRNFPLSLFNALYLIAYHTYLEYTSEHPFKLVFGKFRCAFLLLFVFFDSSLLVFFYCFPRFILVAVALV